MCSQQQLKNHEGGQIMTIEQLRFPAIWRESFKDNKPFKYKINSFIDNVTKVKMTLKKWVQNTYHR